MIRKIKYSEMFSLTRVPAEAFFAESGISGELDFQHFADSWDDLIHRNAGVVLVNENENGANGIIGGIFSRCLMTGDPIATECFWWISKDLRGKSPAGMRLFLAWENIMRAKGAKRIYVGNLHAVNHDDMQKLYARLGYTPLETHYVKSV